MEVDDLELLELVNDYQERSDEPTFNTLDDIPEHISNRKDSTTITIRICRREILQLLQDVITNNNLFYLKRKWNKLMIKEPSASES